MIHMTKRIFGSSLLAMLIMIGFAASAYAQGFGRPSPEQMRERMTQQMTDLIAELKLEEAQTDTVNAILMGSIDKRMKLVEDNNGSRRGLREKLGQVGEETTELLAGVLSDEQMETYRKFTERTNRRRGGRRGGN